eukprot:superscaffoldBa00001261_g9791
MQCADPEDIDLVISYIQARLVVCYLRMKKPQLALEHAHRQKRLMHSLRSDTRQLLQESAVRFVSVAFYEKLFKREFQEKPEVMQSFHEGLPKVTVEACAELQVQISAQELHAALQSLESGKAPGIDGLPEDFYKTFWPHSYSSREVEKHSRKKDIGLGSRALPMFEVWLLGMTTSIQLNPRHFQNHLRQAAVYRMLGKPCQAAKSVLTADWLYCLLGGTERHISTQLKLYWQAMLYQAQATEKDVTVMYTPYTGELTDKDISQAEEAFMKYHPTFTDFIYTDPRGGHVLPQTTDWLSVPAVPKHYLITLGFRRREDGLFLKKIHSRICPSFTGVCAGSGLIEWLQYSSLLFKLGYHREHSTILHHCQAQLATAPYLPQISTQQENTLITMSSANIIIHRDSFLILSVNLSIAIANKKGLRANP